MRNQSLDCLVTVNKYLKEIEESIPEPGSIKKYIKVEYDVLLKLLIFRGTIQRVIASEIAEENKK